MTDKIDELDAAHLKAVAASIQLGEAEESREASVARYRRDVARREFVDAWPRLRDVLRAAERAERVLGGGEGLPDGRPDTYSQRCSAAMWMIHKALYTLKKGGA